MIAFIWEPATVFNFTHVMCWWHWYTPCRAVTALFLSVPTVHLPSFFLSPLLVAVVFVCLGKITKRCFVRGCSCWNPTRSSWREKGAGGSTTPPCCSQNIRLQSCASLPHTETHQHMHTHPQSSCTPATMPTNIAPCQNTNTVNTHKTAIQQYAHVKGLQQ